MLRLSLRDFFGALGAVGLAWVLMFGSGLLQHGWHPGEIYEYAVTEGLDGLIGIWQYLLGAVGLLALVPFRWSSFAIAALLLPAPFLVAIVWECARVPSSHNLLPFELAFRYAEFLPCLGLSALVKVFVRSSSRGLLGFDAHKGDESGWLHMRGTSSR